VSTEPWDAYDNLIAFCEALRSGGGAIPMAHRTDTDEATTRTTGWAHRRLSRTGTKLRRAARRLWRQVWPPPASSLSYSQRLRLYRQFRRITVHYRQRHRKKVIVPHSEEQILTFVDAIFAAGDTPGCIVEAGCYKGVSGAKFSIAAKQTGRKLYQFDSFEGLPENKELHTTSILGHSIEDWFTEGKFCGSLDEVKETISKYGHLEVCEFVKGWFEDTMPGFAEEIVAAYIDVDLASSTRTCIKHLYPLLVPGGRLISQDGDFPLVIEVFDDDDFWQSEVGCSKPPMTGLGSDKMITVTKPHKGDV
jgi:O-methyltransferase